MIGLDTNVLARYYTAASSKDDAATARQCEAARQLIESGKRLMVSQTVMLELEWVLRGAYDVAASDMQAVFLHLLSLSHVEFEDRVAVQSAVSGLASGFDFADALHHASYRTCSAVATFDDKGFARRAKKVGLKPLVFTPPTKAA
jgi:predicted nucleic-acid-binding protein